MLQFISIDKILNHPDNPRKKLGDLSELTESIRANGILQNLTIVPVSSVPSSNLADAQEDDRYYAVIGNRRLAASRQAGLDTVPCVISDMDYQQQIRTMLMENIQRSDLTPIEQADGFQLMLDLGESVVSLAEKTGLTGFSENTVRSRLKLLELDRTGLEKAVKRGVSLMDFGELNKIKDPERRNKVLESIGTNNFKYELKKAIDQEKSEEQRAQLIATLQTFATETEDSNELHQVKYFYNGSSTKDFKIPEDASTTEYFYEVKSWGITLYRRKTAEEIADAEVWNNQLKESRQRQQALKEISERMLALRETFVLDVSNAQAKKVFPAIAQYAAVAMLYGWRTDPVALSEALKFELDENDEWTISELQDKVGKEPYRGSLIATYYALDGNGLAYHNWEGNYRQNEQLDVVYDFLAELGYQISDEEFDMKEGTHELFQPKKQVEEQPEEQSGEQPGGQAIAA